MWNTEGFFPFIKQIEADLFLCFRIFVFAAVLLPQNMRGANARSVDRGAEEKEFCIHLFPDGIKDADVIHGENLFACKVIGTLQRLVICVAVTLNFCSDQNKLRTF